MRCGLRCHVVWWVMAGCGLAGSALPAPGRAQVPVAHLPEVQTLDGLQVVGRRQGLEAAASGGTRLDLSLRQTPASVFVIDRQTLHARGARTTQDALWAVPGLDVAAPPGHGNSVNWRGFGGAQISQLFNGIDVKYATIAARPVDAWIYERVEAIGGPSSFLYGAGAVGGAINYVTRLADLDGPQRGGMLAAGASGARTMAAGFNQPWTHGAARHAVRVDAAHSQRHGGVDADHRRAWTLATSLTSHWGGGWSHTLALEAQDEDNARVYWGSPAVAYGDSRLGILPGTARRNYNVADGHYQQQVLWARSVLARTLASGGTLVNTAYHYDALRDYRNLERYRYTPAQDAVIRSGVLQQRHDQQVYGNRLDWHGDGTLAGRATQWVLGLELAYNRQTRFPQSIAGDVDTVPIDARTPGRFFDVPGTSPEMVPGTTNRLQTLALSMEQHLQLSPRLGLMTGLRHEQLALAVHNHRVVTPASPERWRQRYAATTGRLGLSLEVDDQQQLYAQVSTAADPPAGVLSTAGFSVLRDFDLSRGHQVEAGLKRTLPGGRGWVTLGAYRIVRRNLAIADPVHPGQTVPVGRQSSRGLELALDLQPHPRWRMQGSAGLVDARLDDFFEQVAGDAVSRVGNRPAGAPARVGHLWLDYTVSDNWSLGGDLRAVAARYADNANTVSTAGYGVWGAYLRWRPAPDVALTLRGRNLAGRVHVLRAVGTDMVYLGEPRAIEMELRAAFH